MLAALAITAPAVALEPVPADSATTIAADDGTVVYCVFDLVTDAGGQVTGLSFTDCPDDATIGDSADTDAVTDVSNLAVGDAFVNHGLFTDEVTTITLQRAESGVKTSQYSKPDKGMTTLALFYTFEANEAGGSSCVFPELFGPGGESFDGFYGATGKYEQDWGCSDLRPGKSVKGWRVYEVPKKGPVEVVMKGYDADGEEVFATWVVKP